MGSSNVRRSRRGRFTCSPPHTVYRITVSWINNEEPDEVYFPASEYEVKDGVLTIAMDSDHDVVVPLNNVRSVNIERE